MSRNKLFNSDIEQSCSYCRNSIKTGKDIECRLKKKIKNGKCRKFNYDPLMRVPFNTAALGKYSSDDFKL
ncbi:MAG: hypothetical protein ACI4II_04255 [Acutalibacteraceae bacterium]